VEVRRSALVAHPAERLFTLIEAAEDYPAFLPWCSGVTILERSDEMVSARIEVAWRGVRFGFVTRNPKRAPTWMAIGLADGPFRRFEGEWHLTPLGPAGCRVEFRLVYDFAAGVLGSLAAPVFDRAANTMVDAFVRRADEVAARVAAPAQAAAPAPAATAAVPDRLASGAAAGDAAEGPPTAPGLTPVSAAAAAEPKIAPVTGAALPAAPATPAPEPPT
jgi:ribosome-associated toxin RatA of RatAB toxin-antitoxin module